MTPQAEFMVLAPIIPARVAELRALLDSMNEAPGRVNQANAVVPFAQIESLHFSRLLILDDTTTEDVRVYGITPRVYPLYLAFLGDIDGDAETFFHDLARLAPEGLRALFSCCENFTPEADLVRWMKQHRVRAIANYANWPGRTVRRIREEAALHDALEVYLQRDATAMRALSPLQLRAVAQKFLQGEVAAGRLSFTEEKATPLSWQIKNFLHLIGMPLLILLVLPLLILIAPFYLIRLRQLEKSDPELCGRVDQTHADLLSSLEDHDVTNQFSLLGSIKPGLVRRATLIGVLLSVNYAARHLVRPGRLGRVRSIHFARWVFLDRQERMVFFSNYDGTVESYMDDFINKAGFGLNAFLGNGVGYIKTNWLVLDGCNDEQKYRNFLRRHTLATQVWYKAYPGLTAIDLERNGRIRAGLKASSMSEPEAREWAALL
ncbi:MAG: hypothetical protein ACR2HH_14350 [Chthoniobacterales bacterium]